MGPVCAAPLGLSAQRTLPDVGFPRQRGTSKARADLFEERTRRKVPRERLFRPRGKPFIVSEDGADCAEGAPPVDSSPHVRTVGDDGRRPQYGPRQDQRVPEPLWRVCGNVVQEQPQAVDLHPGRHALDEKTCGQSNQPSQRAESRGTHDRNRGRGTESGSARASCWHARTQWRGVSCPMCRPEACEETRDTPGPPASAISDRQN